MEAGGALVGSVTWIRMHWGPVPGSWNPMIGIWLERPARGKGIGTEAQRQLVDLFFRHTTCNRVEAHGYLYSILRSEWTAQPDQPRAEHAG